MGRDRCDLYESETGYILHFGTFLSGGRYGEQTFEHTDLDRIELLLSLEYEQVQWAT